MGIAWASAALAVVLFALPLAVALHQLFLTAEMGQLERSALRTAITVGPDFAVSDPAELPAEEPPEQLGLYDSSGRRLSGTGPAAADSATRAALAGQLGQQVESGLIVLAIPVSSAEQVIGAVRAATPSAAVWRRTVLAWAALAVIAAIAVMLAAIVARRLARRISAPLEQLAEASRALGAGDFTVRTTLSGMPEIDLAGDALNATAVRLSDLVARERQITSNVSHQLRTPLTGLRASLEAALADPGADLRGAARAAIESVDRVEVRIDELVELTRGTPVATTGVALQPVLQAAADRWRGALAGVGRRLRLYVEEDLPLVSVSAPGIEQILEILLENAMRHGAGTVTVTGRTVDVAVAVDVGDEGSGIVADVDVFRRGHSSDGGAGIGLALARTIAEDSHCRLRVSQRTPSTTLTLLMPTVPTTPAGRQPQS